MKPRYRRMLRAMEAREGAPGGPSWHLYMLECRDGSLYTGVTTDVERRLREHGKGTASRYTRTRLPVALVHREECGSRARALSRECAVKSLSRRRKEELIRGGGKDEAQTEPARAAGQGAGEGQRKVAPRDRRRA